jgi:hypothetical protein
MNTTIFNKTSLPETTQKLPATEITLGYTSLNLTALEVVTALTILYLIHFAITCQLQEKPTWLQSVHSMNLLSHLWRHPNTYLEPQNLRKKDKNGPQHRTNKMHLKQRKALRQPEQERQYDARSITTRRADQGSPKHRISKLTLLFFITAVIPLVEGPALRLDPEPSPHGHTQPGQN